VSAELVVPADAEGMRLDAWLAPAAGLPSRAAAQRLIESGHVLVDGKTPRKRHALAVGERVTVEVPPPEPSTLEAQEMPLDVLYEDEHLLVLSKPAGLVVHPAAGHRQGTLVNALLAHPGGLSSIGGVERPGIVHRLDRDTSGLMIVAKDDATHQALSRQLARREVVREYLALVHGAPPSEDGVIDAPMGRSPKDRKKMAVVERGRPAVTKFHVERRCGAYSLLRLTLGTGRTHQIRVHLAFLGVPVVGDPVYGRSGDAKRLGTQRQLLHAARLTFTHPATGQQMSFESPPAEDMAGLLARLCGV
jgi:23S rRNA pseudouridine1911/1915/1917 synthase